MPKQVPEIGELTVKETADLAGECLSALTNDAAIAVIMLWALVAGEDIREELASHAADPLDMDSYRQRLED